MTRKIFKIESGALMSDNQSENTNKNKKVTPIRKDVQHEFKIRARIWATLRKWMGTFVVGVICAVLGASIYGGIVNIFSGPYEIKGLRTQVGDLATQVNVLTETVTETKNLIQEERQEWKDAITDSEKEMRDYVMQMITFASSTQLRSTDTMAQAIKNCANADDSFGGSSGLTATTLVAYDIITYEEYSAKEIANQRVLLPYRDGKKEGYFYGQLSETGAWDGDCLINIYEDGKLIFIKEATYDDGCLLKSRQVFSYFYSENQKVWAVSDRTNYGDHSEGETRMYKWERDYPQRFEAENVAPKDMIDIQTFQKGLDPNLFAYYCGNVSGGYFNDKTGTAYLVRFFEDNTVRLLYIGDFEDGHFNDNSGDAWYIVKEEDTDYMYYKGKFKNDKIVERTFSISPPLSLDQIKEIIGDRTFNVELHWDKLGVT